MRRQVQIVAVGLVLSFACPCFLHHSWVPNRMAKKYDPRTEALVMETRTLWDDVTMKLTSEQRRQLAIALHNTPEAATTLVYERSHTGFSRIIHATDEDIQRVQSEATT